MTMIRLALMLPAALALAACGEGAGQSAERPAPTPVVAAAGGTAGQTAGTVAPGSEAAPATAPAAGARLGTTIASLGAAGEGGLWLKTPLVKAQTRGRVVNTENGRSAEVTLIPLAGPAGGGSQASIATMQAVGAGLTDLPELEVFGA